MRILIIGDSFASDYSVTSQPYSGWPNLLAEAYEVTNLAQAGVSQYKIWKQLYGLDLSDFDLIIVSFTNPYRVHVKKHPIHYNSILHADCDLILTDIKYHVSQLKNIFNLPLWVSYFWLKFFFDAKYQSDISRLLKVDILRRCEGKFVIDTIDLDFENLFVTNRGDVNHFDPLGNILIFNKIQEIINERWTFQDSS